MKTSAPKDSSRFASKSLGCPQLMGGIKEGLELGCHHAKTRRKSKQKSISLQKLLRPDLCPIIYSWRGLHLLQYCVGKCLRYLYGTNQVKQKLVQNSRSPPPLSFFFEVGILSHIYLPKCCFNTLNCISSSLNFPSQSQHVHVRSNT